jgi:hypothetical protein
MTTEEPMIYVYHLLPLIWIKIPRIFLNALTNCDIELFLLFRKSYREMIFIGEIKMEFVTRQLILSLAAQSLMTFNHLMQSQSLSGKMYVSVITVT